MGIKNLTKLIADSAPTVIKEDDIKNYFGRKVAIDASMSMYQFMIAVRGGQQGMDLSNEMGEVTSHLQGLFSRTIRMLEIGIKPVYVFDGKPPELKSKELEKRRDTAQEAQQALEAAQETGNEEDATKFSKRTVRVSREQTEDAKQLLKLMGMPIVEAPEEAEATCAALCKAGKVYATGTEDMDALTFGTPILIRHLTFSEARKQPIQEFHLTDVLSGLGLDFDQFIDLCMLCGCDYMSSIKGIGPVTALKLIKQHKSMEEILKHLDKTKYSVPEYFPYEEVRKLFKEPNVADASTIDIKFEDPDEEGLVKFLHDEKGFQEERVRKAVTKIRASRKQSTQGRLTDFFGPATKVASTSDSSNSSKKRKGEDTKKGAKGKGVANKKQKR